MRKTVGRRRILTDEQARAILRWHEAQQALKVLHAYLQPAQHFATELGVTLGGVRVVIRKRGMFKQACPSAGVHPAPEQTQAPECE